MENNKNGEHWAVSTSHTESFRVFFIFISISVCSLQTCSEFALFSGCCFALSCTAGAYIWFLFLRCARPSFFSRENVVPITQNVRTHRSSRGRVVVLCCATLYFIWNSKLFMLRSQANQLENGTHVSHRPMLATSNRLECTRHTLHGSLSVCVRS